MKAVDRDSFKIILLVILCLTAALPGFLAYRDFWVEDETRYAEVVREMREEGRWLVPHLNGHIYPDKPPLYFWCVTAITCLTGNITPLSFLLVSWLAALGCILVTYFFAAVLRDSLTALLSALILLSSLLFLTAAQIVRMDMLFAFFIGLSLYCFYRGFQEKRRGYYSLFYLFSAAAVLTKGPLGFAFTFLPVAAFLWLHPRPGAWKQWLRHPGLLLFLGPVFGWLLASWAAGYGDLIGNIFGRQILERSLHAFKHRQPIYYYLLALPPVLLPWTPFLPAALRSHFRKGQQSAAKILLLWFAIGFGLISLISGKLFIYLLPLLPPLAIMTADYFSRFLGEQQKPSGGFWAAALLAALLCPALLALLPVACRYYPGGRITGLPLPAMIFLLLFGAAALFILMKKTRPLLITLFLTPLLFFWLASIFIVPQVNGFYSPRSLGQEIRSYTRQGYRAAAFGLTRGILNFYADTTIEELDDDSLSRFFDPPYSGKRLLIIKSRHLKKNPRLQQQAQIRYQYKMNNETYLLLTATTPQEGLWP